MSITLEYKGFTLEYSDYSDTWAIQGEGYGNPASLKKVTERIDKISKEKFARFDAYYIGWRGNERKLVTVTSMDGPEAWISYPENGNNRRNKVKLNELHVISPENDALYEQSVKLRAKAHDLIEEAEKLIDQLHTLDKEYK